MATNIKRHDKYYTGNGVPSGGYGFSGLALYCHYYDRDSKIFYIYMGGGSWIVDPEYQMGGGGGSAPTVKVGTTTTVAPGTPAKVTDSDASGNVVLNFEIPKGEKGDKGDAGTGGITVGTSAAITVTPTGADDTNNLKAAIAQAKTTGRPIELYGKLKATQELLVDKDHLHLTIKGNNATLDISGHQGTGIKRIDPANNDEALNLMINARWDIQGLIMHGNSNQIGIEPGPQYGGKFNHNVMNGMKTGIHSRFSLFCEYEHNMFANSFNGVILESGVNKWEGATNFNSQSNSPRVSGRYYGQSAAMQAIREAFPNYKQQLMDLYIGKTDGVARGFNILSEIQAITSSYRIASGGVAFGFYDVSGGWLHDYIVEGVSAGAAADFSSQATVVKDWTVERGHIECVNGFSTANINIDILGGEITIRKQFGQYPSKFLKAKSTSGTAYIEIANVPWWIGNGGTSQGQGKCFETSNIATLHFEANQAFNNPVASQWDGPMPTYAGGKGATLASYNTYTLTRVSPHQ